MPATHLVEGSVFRVLDSARPLPISASQLISSNPAMELARPAWWVRHWSKGQTVRAIVHPPPPTATKPDMCTAKIPQSAPASLTRSSVHSVLADRPAATGRRLAYCLLSCAALLARTPARCWGSVSSMVAVVHFQILLQSQLPPLYISRASRH